MLSCTCSCLFFCADDDVVDDDMGFMMSPRLRLKIKL